MKIKYDWCKDGKHFDGEIALTSHVIRETEFLAQYRSILSFSAERHQVNSHIASLGFWVDVDKADGININFVILNFSFWVGLFSIYTESKEEDSWT